MPNDELDLAELGIMVETAVERCNSAIPEAPFEEKIETVAEAILNYLEQASFDPAEALACYVAALALTAKSG